MALTASQVQRNFAVEAVRGAAVTGSQLQLRPLAVRSATTTSQTISRDVPDASFGGRVSAARRIREEFTGNIACNLRFDWINPWLEAWLGEYIRGAKPSAVTLTAALPANGKTVSLNKAVPVNSVVTFAGPDNTRYTLVGGTGTAMQYNIAPARPSGSAQVASGASVTVERAAVDTAPGVLVDGNDYRTFLFEDVLLTDEDDPTSKQYAYTRGVQITGGTLEFPADDLIRFNASYIARGREVIDGKAANPNKGSRPTTLGLHTPTPLSGTELEVATAGVDTMTIQFEGATGNTNLTGVNALVATNFTIGMQPSSAARAQTAVGRNEAIGIAVGAPTASYAASLYYDRNFKKLQGAAETGEQGKITVRIGNEEAGNNKGIEVEFPVATVQTADYNIPEDSGGDIAVPIQIRPLATNLTDTQDPYDAERNTNGSYVIVRVNQDITRW